MSKNPTTATVESGQPPAETMSMTRQWRRTGICLLPAAIAGWVLLNYTPIQFDPPPELVEVNMYSPPALQKAAAENSEKLYWQNGLIKLGFVGLCFGAAALCAPCTSAGRRLVIVTVGLLSGLGCGLLAFALGTYLRRYFNTDVPLPLVNADTRLLVTDSAVYMLTSSLMVVPMSLVMLLSNAKSRVSKAVSILLAGVVAGLVVPSCASVIAPSAQTNAFPPVGPVLTMIWLATLAGLVLAFTSITGSRPAKT